MKEFLSQVDFSLAEDILKLGTREKKALKMTLEGLCESQIEGKAQKPMRIIVTPYDLFDLDSFAKVAYEMDIDIYTLMHTNRDAVSTTYFLQPRLYGNNDFTKGIISSKEATDHFTSSFLDYEPSPIKSKPQK